MRKMNDLTNQKYNRLTALNPTEKRIKGEVVWNCLCQCGKMTLARGSSLKANRKKSCGCISKDGRKISSKKGQAGLTKLMQEYRFSAQKRGLSFGLDRENFKNIISNVCNYCGSSPTQFRKNYITKNKSTIEHGKFLFNGIDRIDSNEGYEYDNVVTCCKKCNYSKNDMSLNEFRQHIFKVYRHFIMGKGK